MTRRVRSAKQLATYFVAMELPTESRSRMRNRCSRTLGRDFGSEVPWVSVVGRKVNRRHSRRRLWLSSKGFKESVRSPGRGRPPSRRHPESWQRTRASGTARGNLERVRSAGLEGRGDQRQRPFTDRAGDLWVGTANNGLYRVHAGQADHFGSADGLSSDAVQSFFEDHEGNLWVATSRGIDRFHDTPVVTYSIHEGLTSEDVDSVLVSRDGSVWVGNMEALDVVHAGRLREIGRRNGLPGNVITSLLEARDGRLWVGVDSGLTVYDHGYFRWVIAPTANPSGSWFRWQRIQTAVFGERVRNQVSFISATTQLRKKSFRRWFHVSLQWLAIPKKASG